MAGGEVLARAVVEMVYAHQSHRPDRQNKALYCCKGRHDPITGHFCQFRGTAQEQHEHVVERVTVAVNTYVQNLADATTVLRHVAGIPLPESQDHITTSMPRTVIEAALRAMEKT